ncbi:hypothetical protein EGW08_016579 [Elysia chlorotica]|uniref:Cytochrome P450 n=1 Tax=Elysia chlorotica TaxID=188477 RepID=A0A3S1HAZ1_ELYCH|nr:hypothetical protein EGW08_016579 [Elysia chlorotica]
MDLTWLLLGLALLLVLAFLVTRYSAWSVRHVFRDLGIETPPSSVFFGHFLEGMKYGIFDVQTHQYKMFKDKKVYGVYEFKTPMIVVRDLDLIKDVCVKHFNNFVDRRVLLNMEPPFHQTLLAILGDHWKKVRSAVSPTFSSGRLKKMCRHIERNAKSLQLVLDARQESGEEVELKEMMSRLTMDTIAGTGFGLDIDSLREPDNEFHTNAQAFTKPNLAVFIVTLMFPFLGKIMESMGIKFLPQKAADFFEKVLDNALRERRESENAGKMHDFLDLMLNAEEHGKEGEACDKHEGVGTLTRNEILSQALVFLLAGYDTVSSVLSFTMFLLAVHPEHQRLVQEELDKKLPLDDSIPDYETVQNLPYLDQCISESMRMFPPGLILDRVCNQEITLHGVRFPKGMPVVLPIYAIHMDPDLWENPKDFKPERFSPEAKESQHQYAYFPFGHGPRNCVAMRLAQLELKIIIATVLRRFDLTPCQKTVYPVQLSSWQLAANDGLWVKPERRATK